MASYKAADAVFLFWSEFGSIPLPCEGGGERGGRGGPGEVEGGGVVPAEPRGLGEPQQAVAQRQVEILRPRRAIGVLCVARAQRDDIALTRQRERLISSLSASKKVNMQTAQRTCSAYRRMEGRGRE